MRTRLTYLALLLPALILSSGGSVVAQTATPTPVQLLEITTLYGKAEMIINQEYQKVTSALSASLSAPSPTATAAEKAAAVAALMKQMSQLQAEKKQSVDELRKQKQIAMTQGPAPAKPVQLGPVCGKPTTSQGMVILIPGNDAGKGWLKSVEGKLGAFKAVQSASLQGGATAGERMTKATALGTETLVEDGAGLLATAADPSAKAKQAILARSLLLNKRVIVVRAPGALSAADKASAKAWGWRVLGDKDTAESVLCGTPVIAPALALPAK